MIEDKRQRPKLGEGLAHHISEHAGIVPPGVVVPYAGRVTTFLPEGWLFCNGDSYRADQYPRLFRAIGYTFGGSGANFNVPDLRSRVPMGAGTYATLGETEGAAEAARTTLHTHNAGTLVTADPGGDVNRTTTGSATAAADHTHNITGDTGSTGSGVNNFPHLSLNFIIKA